MNNTFGHPVSLPWKPTLWSLGLVFVFPTLLTAQDTSKPGGPKIHRPGSGEYQHVWLTFQDKEKAKVFVGLRGGKSTTVWFVGGVIPGGIEARGNHRVLVDSHALMFSKNRLSGTIQIRQVSIWAPMKLLAQIEFAVDAKQEKSKLVGSWSAKVQSDKLKEGTNAGGKLSGTLTNEATIRKTQAFGKAADWPSYHGPHGTNRAAISRASLMNDLTKARPVWRAEMPILSGWGTGVDSRYARRAAVGTVCGGSGTPVFADGRIYLFHYVPAGEPDAKKLQKALADFQKNFKREPLPIERAALIDFARQYSDTIVTCIDAETGAVLWSVTFPRWSGNYQTHKWRGINPTASVIGPAVIPNDLANNCVALDAKTGAVLWTIPRSQKVRGNQAALGAVQAGKLAILPSVGNEKAKAVNPRTGKVVWEQPGGPQALVWGKKGAERVIFIGRKKPTCYDAATGKLLWKMKEKLAGETGSAALIEGDILVGHVLADKKKRGGTFGAWKLSDNGPKQLWQDNFFQFDENLTVTLGEKRAYLVGKDEVRCLDLRSGKLLGKRTFDGKTNRIGSNQWLGLVGDRLLLCPEGQHGRLSLQMLKADPNMKLLGNRWSPPNNSTTAYGRHSIGYPVVDGRVFVRGMDGLYCYDLRKPGTEK